MRCEPPRTEVGSVVRLEGQVQAVLLCRPVVVVPAVGDLVGSIRSVAPVAWSAAPLAGNLGLVTALTALAFFRRRREPAPTAPSAPAATDRPSARPPTLRRGAAGNPPENSSISGGRAGVPAYYEGPPEPRDLSARAAAEARRAKDGAQHQDLDQVLAQLDRLSDQIRRRAPARPPKEPSANPRASDPGPRAGN